MVIMDTQEDRRRIERERKARYRARLRAGHVRTRAMSRDACPKGHPYDEANTYADPRGKAQCRICRCVATTGHSPLWADLIYEPDEAGGFRRREDTKKLVVVAGDVVGPEPYHTQWRNKLLHQTFQPQPLVTAPEGDHDSYLNPEPEAPEKRPEELYYAGVRRRYRQAK